MFFYYLLYSAFVCLTISLHNFSKGRGFIWGLLFLLMVIPAGLRGDIGSDTWAYGLIYNQVASGETWFWLLRMEPVLVIASWIHGAIFGNLTSFFILIAVVQSLAMIYSSRRN